jgi:FlaA1/EpsC-like NDP-sugar epimerase
MDMELAPHASSSKRPELIQPKRNVAFPKTQVRSDKKRILVTGGAGFVGSHLVSNIICSLPIIQLANDDECCAAIG